MFDSSYVTAGFYLLCAILTYFAGKYLQHILPKISSKIANRLIEKIKKEE